ncbi:hypothetical protein N8J89_23470 [Crossiella sp. CA-258035]|uniref:hypothetical protein n=1 Tax=Crossiella sp. CA-258035 TaxID=2981138 RepID=UPI0024BD3716|nr:hypothetical protein [Crossiella sp. CA-258035]WHT16091.1 hypothetical protein N8J89_23470 [Crossiella sp. CA-258035]
MDYPTLPVPEPAPAPEPGWAPEPPPPPRPQDPLAVALGNASLLSVGYFLMRRVRLGVITLLITLALVAAQAGTVRETWLEFTLLGWWLLLVWHGWFLARRAEPVVRKGQRLWALATALVVLLVVGFLRFDAAGIEREVTAAKERGDCGQALSALDQVGFGHRVADAPLTVRGEQTADACQRLRRSADKLTAALTGNTEALKAGFDELANVLANLPGHEKMTDTVLNAFLGSLPAKSPCHTVVVTTWLRQRQATKNTLDRAAEVVDKHAPLALAECGDLIMDGKQWAQAKAQYQQLIDQYPGHELTGRAEEGVRKATLAIELDNVRGLLRGSKSAYCASPAQYSAAPPYGKGTNRAIMAGEGEYTGRLPGEWKTEDPTQAVLVVCAGRKEYGAMVRSCLYQNKMLPRVPHSVAFHKIAIPVRAYELRTGKRVVDAKVEVGGSVCPRVLHYRTIFNDGPPPSQVYVTESDKEVHDAFGWFINQ